MLTQAVPSIIQALAGALPETTVRTLAQAVGNCVQPITHRGSLNIQPTVFGNRRGVYTGQNWSSSKYKDILPNAGSDIFADIPGFRAGDWNSVNYAGSEFYFPTDNYFNTSNFYAGDTTNIGGDTVFQNIDARNITVQNITVTGGGDGQDGRDGRDGEPGPPGDPGTVEPIDPPGGGGQNKQGYPSETVSFVSDVIAPKGRTQVATLKKTTGSALVVTGATFDPTTCQIQLSTTTINYVSDVKFQVGGKDAEKLVVREGVRTVIPIKNTKTFLKPNR